MARAERNGDFSGDKSGLSRFVRERAERVSSLALRIVRAIENLQDAIAYLETAPDNFGGHKAAAIQASRAAIGELRASLAFRAQQDRR